MRITSNLPQGGNLPTRQWQFNGFNLGLNTFSLATEIAGNELSEARNIELYGKKSVRPRRGSVRLGSSLGDPIDGLFQYKDGATNDIIGIANGVAKKYNSGTGDWDTLSGSTFTVGLRVRGVKMQSNLYFGDGTDPFTRYDGATIDQFTTQPAPSNLTVTPAGSTGTTEYIYQVTTVTKKGESLPTAQVTISNGNAILDNTNKNNLQWDRLTSTDILGYNVYGRDNTGNGVTLMDFVPNPTSGAHATFTDNGTITPQIWLPPEGDSTGGVSVTMWEQLRGSLVGAGDPAQPHRLFFSGTGQYFESFSSAQNGGWVDVRPGDNDAGITGLAPFGDTIITAKQRSMHQFLFDQSTGEALVWEIITYVGCGAAGTMVVMENDIAFVDSELKMRILGYEPNFTAGIRTTSLSEGRVQSIFAEIDPKHMDNMEAVYHQGRYYLAVTTSGSTVNNKVIVYDRRYLAFLGQWDGEDCHVRCWCIWDGTDSKQRLYAGSSDTGYVYEFEVEGVLTNHDGTAVSCTLRTRNEDMLNSGQQKLWKWVDLRLFRIQGTLGLSSILNGTTTLDTKQFSSSTSTGWGIVKWGTKKWGVPTGIGADASDLDKTYRKEIYEIGNSLQFELNKTGAQDDFVLISMRGEALLLPTEVFDSANVI